MPTILLVDDDKDTWETVRLALEPRVKVEAIGTRHGALRFLRGRTPGVCGVIVDLNLTTGQDNFGRELLERLREMGVPCVVFSSSIKSASDAERYQNEFGVLGTIGKSSGNNEKPPLEQLRESVELMISVSTDHLREELVDTIGKEFERANTKIAAERERSTELASQTERVAGAAAAGRLAELESRRLSQLEQEASNFRDEYLRKVTEAQTIEALQQLAVEVQRNQ